MFSVKIISTIELKKTIFLSRIDKILKVRFSCVWGRISNLI